jgi:hypothetical protein
MKTPFSSEIIPEQSETFRVNNLSLIMMSVIGMAKRRTMCAGQIKETMRVSSNTCCWRRQ